MTVCDINLIAGRRRQKQRALALMRFGVYSLMTLVLVLAFMYARMMVAGRLVAGRIQEVEARLTDPALEDAVTRVQFLEGRIAEYGPRVSLLEKVHDSERAWIEILEDVSLCMPADMNSIGLCTLLSRRVDTGQEIAIRGSARSQRNIGEFMLALDMPQWSGVPELGFTQASTNPANQRDIDFEISVPLRQIIGSDL